MQPLDDAMREVDVEDAARKAVQAVASISAAAHAAESIDAADNVPLERQTFSLGYVCTWLSVPPATLRQAMKQAGVSFAGSHNDVPYLDAAGLLAVSRKLRENLGGPDSAA